MVWLDEELTRRQVIRVGAAGGLALGAGGALAGCFGGDDDNGKGGTAAQAQPSDFRRGGTLRVGATGGGAEDTVDGHKPTSDPDIMRTWQLFEPLAVRNGAFTYKSLSPGEQSTFVRFPNYWRKGEPYVDELVIIDFTEPTAKVNALVGGQVEAINNVPFGQLSSIQGNGNLRAVV